MEPLQNLISLNGKTAIVTGGAKGIGKGIAYRLAEAGAKVLIADIDEAGAQATAAELTQHGWTAQPYGINLVEEDQIKRLVEFCQQQFGSIDILVNNAGIYPMFSALEVTAESFDKVINLNLRGTILMSRYVAEVMKAAGQGGRIVNITSIDALHPSAAGLAIYDASKHGLWGFTKNLALELAQYKIQVNAVAPGSIDTPGTHASAGDQAPDPAMAEAFLKLIPMHRSGTPDEIGRVVLFLASDLAAYMTGSQIVVDGGRLLS